MKLSLLSVALCVGSITPALSVERVDIEDSIYTQISRNNPCWRLLNDREVGCQSNEKPQTGAAFSLNTELSETKFESTADDVDVTVVIPSHNISSDLLRKIAKSDGTKSVFVLDDGRPTNAFSPALQTPNADKGLYFDDPERRQFQWNLDGNGENINTSFSFPMTFITEEADLTTIESCAQNNIDSSGSIKSFPLCSSESDTFMFGAGDAETCLRRGFCDPLGDFNVYGFLNPIANNSDFIVAATALDSTALFKDRANGASTLTGVVTLLAAADALSKVPVENRPSTNILFSLFNGEAYDYIGSSRFVYDLSEGKFPFNSDDVAYSMDNIKGVVEIGQVGSRGDPVAPSFLFAHSHPTNASQAATTALIDNILSSANDADVDISSASRNDILPPSSLQMFLRRGNRDIPGVVITDHDQSFTNRYYQSFLDNADNILAQDAGALANLCAVSTLYAQSLFRAAGGTANVSSIQADCSFVTNYIQSTTVSMNTTYMQELFNDTDCSSSASVCDFDRPLSLYVGVSNGRLGKFSSAHVAYLALTQFLGTVDNSTAADCNKFDSFTQTRLVWTSGECRNATAKVLSARSPGFNGHSIRDSSFSIWTESRWDSISHRSFLAESTSTQYIILGFGIVVLLASFGITFTLVNRAKHRLKRD